MQDRPARLWLAITVLGTTTLIVLIVLVGEIRILIDPSARARAAAVEQAVQPATVIAAVLWQLIPPVLVLAGAGVGLAIAWRRYGWRDRLMAEQLVRGIDAGRQRLPDGLRTLTYSPHTHQQRPTAPAQINTQTIKQVEQVEQRVPAFAELLADNRIGRGNPLLLGYNQETGREINGAWLDLYATATAGLPGTGKTTSQRFYAAQTALHGARFVVCDPHADASEDSLAATLAPLNGVYLCDPASSPAAILESVRYVASIGEKRIKGLDSDRTPIILWVDELTSLLGRSDVGDRLAEELERIVQEYRKRWIYLSASGQIWTASRTTSELRDSFASVLCHRMKRSQARLLLPTDEAATVERLSVGQAVLWRTNGSTTTVSIPNTTAADVTRVARLLTDNAPTMTIPRSPSAMRPAEATSVADQVAASVATQSPRAEATEQPQVSHSSATVAVATTAPQRDIASAEALRAATLFFDGRNPAEIVLELRGIRSSQGKTYQRALDEVLELIREGARGDRRQQPA